MITKVVHFQLFQSGKILSTHHLQYYGTVNVILTLTVYYTVQNVILIFFRYIIINNQYYCNLLLYRHILPFFWLPKSNLNSLKK